MELSIRDLLVTYAHLPALEIEQLVFSTGITAVLGPNGAGKSTLLRTLATLMKPQQGLIAWDGIPLNSSLTAARSKIGYLPQDIVLPENLTARQFLQHMALLKNENPLLTISAANQLELSDCLDMPSRALSGGQLRMVCLIQALCGNPNLLALDEPFLGLDLNEQMAVSRLLAAQARQSWVIFSTHLPALAEQIADNILVLQHGKVRFFGKPYDLAQLANQKVWTFQGESTQADRISQGKILIRIAEIKDQINLRLISESQPCPECKLSNPTLEDGYIWLINQPAF